MLVVKIETMTSSVIIPKQTEVESAVREWIDDCVWRQEIKRAETGGLAFSEPNEIETMGRDEAHQLDGLLRYASNLFAPQEKAAIARALTGNEPSERHRSIIARAAQRIGMSADPNTVAGRLVERTILRGYATLLDELRQPIIDRKCLRRHRARRNRPRSFSRRIGQASSSTSWIIGNGRPIPRKTLKARKISSTGSFLAPPRRSSFLLPLQATSSALARTRAPACQNAAALAIARFRPIAAIAETKAPPHSGPRPSASEDRRLGFGRDLRPRSGCLDVRPSERSHDDSSVLYC
jgi:hypothetical protein